jgi:uncharacterized repeat protein (TIGR01451 family)
MGEIMRILCAFSVAAMTVLTAAPSWAACPAANQYNFNFSSQTTASLSYASSYTYAATSAALGTQNFTVGFVSPVGYNAVTGIGTLPEISADVNGGTGNALVLGGILAARTVDITNNTTALLTTLSFPTAVRDLTFTIHDIDFLNNQFRDWVHFVGVGPAGNYVPALVTPFSMANVTGPFTNGSSSVKLGPQGAPVAVAVDQATGVGASANNSTTGNVTISFAQPVTSVQFRYGNYPLQTGETATGQQFTAISTISWCPMPQVTLGKTVAPWSDPVNGTTNPKQIPGGDVIYTLTVTNSNSSPVDLSTTVLTDPLPPEVTFFNGDIDDAGPLTTNYDFNAGTTGLTFGTANLTYSSNAGATYAYTPSAGYDALVTALRFAPVGSMAANSSFTLKFRARIK